MNSGEIEFDWDEANVRHVARHCVLPDDTEHVIFNDPVDIGVEIADGGYHMARRSRGRRVTALDPIKRLIQFYYQKERGDPQNGRETAAL